MAKKKNNTIKCDTSENWSKAKFIPKENEIIVYSDLKRMKIGDGHSRIGELSFVDVKESSLYNGYFIKEEI